MTKRLSKEDREKIAEELRYPFGRVELQCDQYKVSLHVRSCGARRQTIVAYVGGWVRGEWLMHDCEERRRFMRETESYLFSAKDRAQFLKRFGKRAFARSGMDKKVVGYRPNWNAVTSMLRQFHRTCESVELIAIGYKSCTVDVQIEYSIADTEPKSEEADA